MIWIILSVYFLIGGIVAYRTQGSSASKKHSLLLGVAWLWVTIIYILGWYLTWLDSRLGDK
jgi:Kef-type K+ transport system membrane component KefB